MPDAAMLAEVCWMHGVVYLKLSGGVHATLPCPWEWGVHMRLIDPHTTRFSWDMLIDGLTDTCSCNEGGQAGRMMEEGAYAQEGEEEESSSSSEDDVVGPSLVSEFIPMLLRCMGR